MKKAIYFFLLFTFELSAQQILSPDQAKQDVDFLYKRMTQIHPGLYAYQDSAAYAETFKNIRSSFTKEVDYLYFFNRISPLLYEIKDLHTSFHHSKSWTKKHKNKLPFVLKEVEGKILINYNASSDSTFSRGLELISIENKPIREITDYLAKHIGTDNGNEMTKAAYAIKYLYSFFPKYFELGDTVSVKVKSSASDSLVDFKLKTISTKTLISNIKLKYPDKVRENLAYSILDSSKSIAKIDVSSFVKRKTKLDFFQRGFDRGLKDAFQKISQDTIQNLVLDFRANGGGYIPNVAKLLKYVLDEPFKTTDTLAFKRKAYFKIFPIHKLLMPIIAPLVFNKKDPIYRYRVSKKKKTNKNKIFKGNLYVFMDATSYSATVMTIAALNNNNRATFIGTIPGGANWGSFAGAWSTIKLPNSGVRVRIPHFKITHPQNEEKVTPFFIEPNYEVDYSKKDFDLEKDSYERFLMELLSSKN